MNQQKKNILIIKNNLLNIIKNFLLEDFELLKQCLDMDLLSNEIYKNIREELSQNREELEYYTKKLSLVDLNKIINKSLNEGKEIIRILDSDLLDICELSDTFEHDRYWKYSPSLFKMKKIFNEKILDSSENKTYIFYLLFLTFIYQKEYKRTHSVINPRRTIKRVGRIKF